MITIRGPQRYMRYVGQYRTAVDAAIASTYVAEVGESVRVVPA